MTATLQYPVHDRWTGAVKFTAEITCEPDASDSAKLGLAVRWAITNDADLSGADLRGASLSGADLRDADLSGADLSGADLSGADLRDASLSGADLSGADLRDASLSDASLRGADLSCASLSCASLRGADLRDASLSGASLSGADLRGASLSGADLRDASLSGAPVIKNIHQRVYAAASQDGALDMGTWGEPCGTTRCRAGWVVNLAGEEGAELERQMGTPAAATLIYLASDPTLDKFPSFYSSNAAALEDMKRLADLEAAKGEAA